MWDRRPRLSFLSPLSYSYGKGGWGKGLLRDFRELPVNPVTTCA